MLGRVDVVGTNPEMTSLPDSGVTVDKREWNAALMVQFQ